MWKREQRYSKIKLAIFYPDQLKLFQNLPPQTIEEFIENIPEPSAFATSDAVTPKHYRLILNPILNGTQNQLTFNGNVWITVTPNADNVRTIELDVQNLDIRGDDVSVYRSRILSQSSFRMKNERAERSAKLIEDDASSEDDHSDMLMNSSESVDSSSISPTNDKVLAELTGEVEDNLTTVPTDPLEEVSSTEGIQSITDATDASSPLPEYSTDDPSLTTATEPTIDVDPTWDGLSRNDTMIRERNPDDQTQLEVDSIQLDTERQKLIITLSLELRRGHYYIVKVFFSGNVTSDYGLVYKSFDDGVESNAKFG